MALGDYTPTAWANGTTPAINATNLGHIETKIDEIDAASAATSSTRIWSTSNDGNGGQPPASKPNLIGNTTPGYEHVADLAIGNTYVLGSGGTWLVQALNYPASFTSNSPSGSSLLEQIANGGATITGQGATGRFRFLKLT